MKPTFASDFDDVILDFNGAFIAWHNEKYGTNMEYSRLYTHDMPKVWDEPLEVMLSRVDEFLADTDVRFTPLIPGAKKALLSLADSYDLQIVTARSRRFAEKTKECLKFHGLHIFSDVHFTNEFNSHPEYPVTSKPEVCQKIGAIALIEDAPKHAVTTAKYGTPVLLFDRPWNQQDDLPTGITRIYSWDEVAKWLQSNS